MAHRIVVLGGGTGGTIAANRLRRALPRDQAEIVVVDRDDGHVYQPGLLFMPFGLADGEIVRPRHDQLLEGVEFREATVDRVDLDRREVHLASGAVLAYDVLVVATGAVLTPEETPGLLGPGWMEKVFTFYSVQGAAGLHYALRHFHRGRVVVAVMGMPIKSPVAPVEFCFLADWHFRVHGRRDDVELTYVTPLDGAFARPVASERLGGLLAERGVELVTQFHTERVDGPGGTLQADDGRTIGFDLAVVVPRHRGAPSIARSPGLSDARGFVEVDPHTLQSTASPEVFAIGDAAGIPAAKAGSVTHFEGEVLTENIRRFLAGQPLDASFDGHTSCFVETGFHRAVLLDYDYDTEPHPGRFPGPVGLPLLEESHLNHLGKLLFQPLYWHTLLPGRDLPGIRSTMPVRGKEPTRSASGHTDEPAS